MSTSYRVGAGELGEDVMIRRRTSFSHQHESENLMPCSIARACPENIDDLKSLVMK